VLRLFRCHPPAERSPILRGLEPFAFEDRGGKSLSIRREKGKEGRICLLKPVPKGPGHLDHGERLTGRQPVSISFSGSCDFKISIRLSSWKWRQNGSMVRSWGTGEECRPPPLFFRSLVHLLGSCPEKPSTVYSQIIGGSHLDVLSVGAPPRSAGGVFSVPPIQEPPVSGLLNGCSMTVAVETRGEP